MTPLPSTAEGRRPVAIVVEVPGPIDLDLDQEGAGRIDLGFRRGRTRLWWRVAARYEKKVPAKIRAEGVAAVREGFRVEGRWDLPVGLYDAQATVRLASPAQLGTWSGPLAVPPEPSRAGMRFAGGILSRDAQAERPLLARAAAPSKGIDPLEIGPGLRPLPPADPTFTVGNSAFCSSWIDGV